MSILENINSPKDIKDLSVPELNELCSEIRELLINTVSQTGGHLASNLGVVELTVALHKVFDSPNDQIVFDVGHQCYTHKILTGRREQFPTLRTENGLSGFVRPNESEHDMFSSGHSSVSVSQAIGLAKAKQIKGEDGKVIAIIGDGALTGGLAFESLNNSGGKNNNFIVIVNDNDMSISKNVGSMSKHLNTIRTSKRYFTFKSKMRKTLTKIPKVGDQINRCITVCNSKIRKQVYHNATFFEDMGFRYYGPIDGHNLDDLIAVLNAAKKHNNSVVIHVKTTKGKGYKPAEKDPTRFHGIGKFDIETGKSKSSGSNFSSAFGQTMCELAKNDDRICCVTAAMASGTGLSQFAKEYPDRFFDVGIAEQHAVTFSSGLAKNGMIPVFAVYSTFLQRSYDQLIHDVAMQDLKIIFGIDRAGLIGEDGESHQGVFDVSFLNTVPNFTIFAPCSYNELSQMFKQAIYEEKGACAVRYPRGGESDLPSDYVYDKNDFTVFGNVDSENCIITYGREFAECYNAYQKLDNTFLIKINKIKPINEKILGFLHKTKNVYFYEESIKLGGIGETLAAMIEESDIDVKYHHFAVNPEFVKQASVPSQVKRYKLDCDSIVNEVENGKEN